MKIKETQHVPYEDTSAYNGVEKQILIGPADGSEEIAMRRFIVEPGGNTPYHHHDFPHLVRVEEGHGVAIDKDGGEHPLKPGNVVYVHNNEVHGFKNTGSELFAFICIVPRRGEK